MDKKGRYLCTAAASSVIAASDELNVPVFLPDRWVVLAGSVSLLTQQLVHVPEVPSTGGTGLHSQTLLCFVAAFQFYPSLFLCLLTNSRHFVDAL